MHSIVLWYRLLLYGRALVNVGMHLEQIFFVSYRPARELRNTMLGGTNIGREPPHSAGRCTCWSANEHTWNKFLYFKISRPHCACYMYSARRVRVRMQLEAFILCIDGLDPPHAFHCTLLRTWRRSNIHLLYVTGFAKIRHVVSCAQLYLQVFYYLRS